MPIGTNPLPLAPPPLARENRHLMRGPRFLLIALAALASSCATWVTPPGTHFTSEPPGARVMVDGRDSGYVTPCMVNLADRGTRVRMELDGYETAEFLLRSEGDVFVIPWYNGDNQTLGYRFPLYHDANDLFFPFKVDNSLSPARLHIELQRSAAE